MTFSLYSAQLFRYDGALSLNSTRKSAVSQAPAASTAISEAPGDGSSGQREEKAEAPRSPELSPCLQNGGSPPAQSR